MRTWRKLAFLGTIVALGCGACAPVGVLYHRVTSAPPTEALNKAEARRKVVKTGRACATGVLGLVAWGDASQAAAASDGGITQVHTVDVYSRSVLGFVYRKYCLIVSGV